MEPAGFYVFARRGRRIYRLDKCLITSPSRVPRSLKLKDGIVNLDRRKFRGQGRRADLLPPLPSESMREGRNRSRKKQIFKNSRYGTLNGYSERYLLAEASLWKPGRHKDVEESPLSRMRLICHQEIEHYGCECDPAGPASRSAVIDQGDPVVGNV